MAIYLRVVQLEKEFGNIQYWQMCKEVGSFIELNRI